MYKKSLFSHGVKSFIPYFKGKKATQSYGGNGRCGSGVKSNIDDQLLSLVRGVSRLSVTPKQKARKSGNGLRFVR